MNETNTRVESFLPLRRAAVRLGVPAAWLRAEAEAGRVPHLRVGRRLLVNPQAVERVLLERARQAGEKAVAGKAICSPWPDAQRAGETGVDRDER